MELSNLIYLDASFIVEVYETIHNRPVPIKVSRTENMGGGVNVGFINLGASTTETKDFPISTRQMYQEVKDTLLSIPTVDLSSVDPKALPEHFWTKGIFGATQTVIQFYGGSTRQDSFFSLYHHLSKERKDVILVTNDMYLSTGYDQIQKHLGGSCSGFGIEVHGLFKLLATDPTARPICAPLIMEKLRNI